MNNLLMEVENEIAVVTINRPKSLNALNSETLAELDQCFSEISRRKDIRVVILTGSILYILISGTEIRPDFRAFHDLRGGKTTALDCSRYRCPSLPDALFARPPPEK